LAIKYLDAKRIRGTSRGKSTLTPLIDGSDTVLIFTENGTFTPAGTFNVDYLVVGGGAGGGRDEGAGGGAGGYLTGTSHQVTAQDYNIIVGTGGAGSGNSENDTGTNGRNSSFSSFTAIGGGGGGYSGSASADGDDGGSGGGGAGSGSGGSATSGQGYAGGSAGGTGGNYPAGGGGGAGAVGVTPSSNTSNSGNGGVGLSNSITGTAKYYAGGGGGGIFSSTHVSSGGLGGGGDGSCFPEAGEDGLGGGGGGQSNNGCSTRSAGKGGSGVVIIKFTTSGNSYTAISGSIDEKSTLISDSLGSDGNATNNGAGLSEGGDLGVTHRLGTGSLDFEHANTDYIDASNLQTNNAMGGTGTIAFWFKQESWTGAYLWSVGDTNGTDGFIYFEQQATDKWSVTCGGTGGVGQNLTFWKVDTTVETFSDGSWYHCVITHDGGAAYGAVKLWINGIDRSVNSNNPPENVNGAKGNWTKWTNMAGVDNMHFGRWVHNNVTQAPHTDGLIDDIGIWNRALSKTEILSLFNSGTGNLCSTIPSGLRAYYNCNSETTDNNAIVEELPINTVFEETDTYKTYWLEDSLEEAVADTSGKSHSPIWKGFPLRGVFGGSLGSATKDDMEYIAIATTGNATDFGNLTTGRDMGAGVADLTRGCFCGGKDTSDVHTDIIDYITVATISNAIDFGNLSVARRMTAGVDNDSRGVIIGGYTGSSYSDVMDYITIAATGNATTFGDSQVAKDGRHGLDDNSRGVIGGGGSPSTNVMDYVTIASVGGATDFGDLNNAVGGASAVSNNTRGCFCGGQRSVQNDHLKNIDYITIATAGNADDFGDLLSIMGNSAGCDNKGRGVIAGGDGGGGNQEVIQYITIDTTGNATDFGDLTARKYGMGALSA